MTRPPASTRSYAVCCVRAVADARTSSAVAASARRPLFDLAIEQLVGPPHAVIGCDAGGANGRIIHGVAAKVDLLRRFFPGHARLVELLCLRPEVAQVSLPVIELGFAGERAAVAGERRVEIQLLQRLDGLDPLGE